VRRDLKALGLLLPPGDNVAFVLPNGEVGTGGYALRRAVEVSDARGRQLGRVVVGVPLDPALINRLDAAAGVPEGDGFAISENGRYLTRPPETGDRRSMWTPLASGTDLRLVAFAPNQPIADATSDTRRRVFFATLLTLALIALAWGSATRFMASRAAPAPAPRRRALDLVLVTT
jgi:hypothetical protein